MKRRSEFITFLTALIPGTGYMYLGLMRRGIEALVIFFAIKPLFSLLGLGFIGSIIKVPFWFYCFFDTFNVAHKMDRGIIVEDTGFIIDRIVERKKNNMQCDFQNGYNNYNDYNIDKRKWIILGWCIIILGILGIINKTLAGSMFFMELKSFISKYFIPAAFVIGGIALLKKNKY
ncbi:hypothetical protein CLTEP_06500 [Clostridium tepidiprofundi DSM 19306]|uniref:TM2 domain protein n=1 Tax=Clostridium tepidiprofundi DSM 19306 TaxID=1121338 RepID=A0A151B6F9_9CLOT|nr:hypothetical protein [Clostridium tepidiprofundi]KYH35474.1 hypothetical protein CLTEP_06500 [Clostridium tepidiprofundi DSM 19306]